jgi:hypothetical protein
MKAGAGEDTIPDPSTNFKPDGVFISSIWKIIMPVIWVIDIFSEIKMPTTLPLICSLLSIIYKCPL